MLKTFMSACAVVAVLGMVAIAAEIETAGVKCLVVSSRAVNAAKSADYMGGKVFFCCGNCLSKFNGEPAKFAKTANHQLVVTKQATQIACPFTGGPINEDKTVTVNGAQVAFCCGNCQGKAAGMEVAAQMDALFSDEPFKTAFEIKTE